MMQSEVTSRPVSERRDFNQSQLLTDFASLQGRVALFGGTFDPIHNGHLGLALAAKTQLDLDAVVFVPANKNPLKERGLATSRADRLHMVAEAIGGIDGLYVSPIDLRRNGPSYTVNTVREVWQTLPAGSELFFLAGADVFSSLGDWQYLDELLPLVQFAPVTRDSQADLDVHALAEVIGEEEAARLIQYLVHYSSPESSSEIREKVQRGLRTTGLVPESVRQFIQRKNIYIKERV